MGWLDSEEVVETRIRCPRHLWAEWELIRRRIRKPKGLGLLVDFDGTLARITRLPQQACLPGEVRELLAAIAACGVLVGVVSGRILDDIRRRVALPGIWYVGTHGFSLSPPEGPAIHLATAAQKTQIARTARSLERRLRGLRGVQMERKDASVAIHYRNASRRSRLKAIEAVKEVGKQAPRLRLLRGKQVWELLPDSRVSKWSAVQRILRHDSTGRQGRNGRRLVFYLGDDATDEVVFENLSGVSIAVGKRCRTRACYFLKSPAEVRRFLRVLLEEVA